MVSFFKSYLKKVIFIETILGPHKKTKYYNFKNEKRIFVEKMLALNVLNGCTKNYRPYLVVISSKSEVQIIQFCKKNSI